MRSFTFLVKGMALAAVVLMNAQCTGEQTQAPAAEKQDTAAASGELKLAYVRVDTLLSQYNLSKDLNEIMLRKEENARATLNEKGRDLQNQMAEFQRKLQNNAFVSEERARQENDRLQKVQQNLQELQTRLASELDAEGKKNTQILHDHPVQPALIIRLQVGSQLLQLVLFEQGIDRKIQVAAVKMGETDPLAELLFLWIVRISSGSEPAAPDIDRVRARIHRGTQAFQGSGRRQKFCLMSHNSSFKTLPFTADSEMITAVSCLHVNSCYHF